MRDAASTPVISRSDIIHYLSQRAGLLDAQRSELLAAFDSYRTAFDAREAGARPGL
jgi:hypothetical protein